MRIAVAQLNPTVGDLPNNVAAIRRAHTRARELGAQLVVTPEMAVTGYPPRDLLDRPGFVRDAISAAKDLVGDISGPALLVGAVVNAGDDPLATGDRCANGALLIRDGQVVACHKKVLLPTYDVFDETRYFMPGDAATVAQLNGVRLGLSVCEDAWNDKGYWHDPRYARDPIEEQVRAGADILINLSSSPYQRQKPALREEMLGAMANKHQTPLLYVNQMGGNDALIFDGGSLAFSKSGAVTLRAPAFEEAMVIAELHGGELRGDVAPAIETPHENIARALTVGIRDYVHKCGFEKAVIGLSGGIDSALTCALAVRALGAQNVMGVTMPSRYSSEGAAGDALDLGQRLGIPVHTIPIEPMFESFLDALAEPFDGLAPDVTEENIQARIRGTLLMAYSNKLPRTLLLTTGNKSELAVGYCTLYGDMSGGLAVISDLYKTEVYALAQHLNDTAEGTPPIPPSSITKPPSAELRPDQTDQDSLPPYEDLDAILRGFVDEAVGIEALIHRGHDPGLVRRMARLVQRTEYKRRQMPPGLRVSTKAFGEGRRYPIAQRYEPS